MAKEHRFDLFRLSLRKRRQIDIIEALDPKTREEWLRNIFGLRTEFRHHGVDYIYVPLDPKRTYPSVVGRIGREISKSEKRMKTLKGAFLASCDRVADAIGEARSPFN